MSYSASPWKIKISNANKYYTQWEDRFKCKRLEDYWEGFQWKSLVDLPYWKPYVVNLIYAELKKKLANILYQNIEYQLSPNPGNYGDNPEFAMMSANKKQDFLNTMIARANVNDNLNDAVQLCAMDSYFRFGVMEVGYAADWRNPAKKPIVTENAENDFQDDDAKVIENLELPENERIYFKRIKASRFRVSVSDDPHLSNCSWCGYYSYIYKDTLLNTKGIKFPNISNDNDYGLTSEFVDAKVYMSNNSASADSKDLLELMKQGKVCKVWNIVDNEQNLRKLILEPSFETIWEKKIERIPFETHRHDFRLDGWYPIPPVYQWLAPQDEVNQAREQMRNYRRRFTRKFRYYGIDQEELEKFKSETDGEIIRMKGANSLLEPIGNPEIGISITEGLTAGRDDFNIVSGSSSDLNTVQSDRTTATQSKISQLKAEVIENFEQTSFSKLYIKIGRAALIEAAENFSTGVWVKDTNSSGMGNLGDMNVNISPIFQYISSQDLSDGYDCDIAFSVVNASPAKMQEEFEKFVKFLTMVNQFPQINLSPILIREVAYRCQYRNEKVIAEMQRAAQLAMMGQAAQMAQQQGMSLQQASMNANNGANGNMIRNAAPSSQDVIDQQLM